MTPQQLKALMEWVTEIARTLALSSGDVRIADRMVRAHRDICQAFGFTHTDFMGNPVRPPADEPAEPREWRAQVHTACEAAAEFGVVDKFGTWWTDQHGAVWKGTHENAKKRARELNRVGERT